MFFTRALVSKLQHLHTNSSHRAHRWISKQAEYGPHCVRATASRSALNTSLHRLYTQRADGRDNKYSRYGCRGPEEVHLRRRRGGGRLGGILTISRLGHQPLRTQRYDQNGRSTVHMEGMRTRVAGMEEGGVG